MKGNDDPSILNINMHTSPWRFYDGDMRILTVDDVAELVGEHVKKVGRIQLVGSWTGVAPDASTKSLAQKLSEALKGFPVTGTDGFLWISSSGETRTTRQAFTLKQGRGPYYVAPDEEVMVSLVAGWPAEVEDHFAQERNAEGIMRAGAGWDIYFLCPDRALQAFEAAAKLSDPVAAYNAAMMRLDRNSKGDVEAATALLAQAAGKGDKKAQARLEKLRRVGR
jgi:TPR repeat protein